MMARAEAHVLLAWGKEHDKIICVQGHPELDSQCP
jgi:hypothetical protein